MSYHQFPELYDERLAPVRAETGGSILSPPAEDSANPRSFTGERWLGFSVAVNTYA